jgi:hypothetical protein
MDTPLKNESLTPICRALHNKKLTIGVCVVFCISLLLGAIAVKSLGNVRTGEEIAVQLSENPMAAVSSKKGLINIPSGVVKSDPFLPYRDIGSTSALPNDVPLYSLVDPPEIINESSDAARVMDTIVSGILYDKYSPSAILNIEGNDYLVKKGDVVNNYKVLNILQDSVTVKLGSNVYKAGIGEILTEGTLNHNNVSNLNKKFGGEK